MRTFPADHVASGWYMVGWSHEFPHGEARPLAYFGTDLVAFRGESGTLRVLDAYCRHMGAHLGYDGTIEAECIRCPYHGWLWGPDGQHEEIPYSTPDKMSKLRLGVWRVHEVDGVVMVYYSTDGSDPIFEPPASLVRFDGETWPVSTATTKVWLDQPISPQYVAENAADAAHFKYVHRAADVAEIADFKIDGGLFSARLDLTFGGHAPTTWATPNGPVEGRIITEHWGLGFGWTRLTAFDDVIYTLGITPTSPYSADLRSTTWVARERSDGSEMSETIRDRWVAQQNAQVDADLRVWTKLSYIQQAPWAHSESAAMRPLRAWARQFYRQSAEV
jgi:phenylpropionate dioxygenase-like ring-hydroxylating dioxygenase large terminal subunit